MVKKLSNEAVVNIYNALKNGAKVTDLAFAYDTHPATISSLKKAEHSAIADKKPLSGNTSKMLTNNEVIDIYKRLQKGEDTWSIAKDTGASTQNIGCIKDKRTHKDLLKDLPEIPKTRWWRISDEQAVAIYTDLMAGLSKKDVMEKYGVGEKTVVRIKAKFICKDALQQFPDLIERHKRLVNINEDSKKEIDLLLKLGVRQTVLLKKYNVTRDVLKKVADYKNDQIITEDFTESFDNYKAIIDLKDLGVPNVKIAKRFNITPMQLHRFIKKCTANEA